MMGPEDEGITPSASPLDEVKRELKYVLPQAFPDDQLDFEALRDALGDSRLQRAERSRPI